jgi:glyoxylase I family protein
MFDENKARKAAMTLHGVRYQVQDVERSIAFYTQNLGFELEHQAGSGIRQRIEW